MDTKILTPLDLPDPNDRRGSTETTRPNRPKSPYSVTLVFADSPKHLQFELVQQASLGRRSEGGDQPDVDLAPFGAFPAGVSRLHARLIRTADGIMLEDLHSRNGTFVDDRKLAAGESAPIRNGQSLKLGSLLGWIYFENPKISAPESTPAG